MPATPPQRIVSLVPSLTETICEFGVGCRLVGVSRYCSLPEEPLLFVPRVGGTKNPDLEKIASLEPDLVLLNGEENRDEDFEWISQRFPALRFTPRGVSEVVEVLETLGKRLGLDEESEAMQLEIKAQMLRSEVESVGLEGVRVFYPIWRQPWISINRDTYVHDVLERAGAINVCASRESRYPVVTEDHFALLAPDLVLLPSEPFAFTRAHRRSVVESEAFGRGVPVLLVDGKNFCWHGSRTGRGLGRVTDLLKPFRCRA
ncbi:MAG: ABC transporter substrate-binding protein [Planctomycetes bacterium]|nr:ABC transporter substrate-binding protein [Planctomycetota bacterium]